MRLLVDTSAYSAFMRGHSAIKSSLQRADEIVVNAIVLGELAAGFIKGGRRRRNQEELSRFLSSPRVNVVDVTEETAERYGVILNSAGKRELGSRLTIFGSPPAPWNMVFRYSPRMRTITRSLKSWSSTSRSRDYH